MSGRPSGLVALTVVTDGVETVLPSAVKVIYELAVGLLTRNRPRAIDAHTREVKSIVSTRLALLFPG